MSEDKKIQELVEAAARKRQGTAEEVDTARPVEDAGSQALSESLKSSFLIVKVILVILVIFFFRSLIFTVPSQESAVILRFGKPVMKGESILLEPGAHWAFPYPIDEIVRIPLEEIQTLHSSVGWYMSFASWEASQTEPPAYAYLDPAKESYTLTADTNIIHVRAVLKYRINDPLKYAFDFANTTNVVQDILDSALYHASARFTADQAVRLDVKGFEEAVIQHVKDQVDNYDVGITLETTSVISIPPRFLKEAFDQTQFAAQESSSKLSEARGYAEQSLARAKGEAEAVLNAGHADRLRMVEQIRAESQYFKGMLPAFEKNPELFKERMLVESVGRVMSGAQEKFVIVDREDGQPRELRVLLNREPKQPTRPDDR